MNKKFTFSVILLVLISVLLSACAGAATPAVEPTAVPTVVPAASPTEALAPAPDVTALWAALIKEIPSDIGYGTITAVKLNEELVEKAPFLLDVREADELESAGYIEGAVNIPVSTLFDNLDKLPAQDQPIVVYCGSGHRGGYSLAGLKLMGYTNVRNLAGGIGAWKKAELPIVTGTAPAAPVAGAAPVIADQALFEELQSFFADLPENYYATNAEALNTDLADGKEYFLLDVRRAEEVTKTGYLAGSVNIPLEELYANLDKLPATDTPIVVYCVSGHRASIAQMGLRLLGYEYALNLGGGFNGWKAGGYAIEGIVDWGKVWGEYLAALPEGFSSIGAADLNALLADKPLFILDVREAAELQEGGYIAGAVNIPIREVLANLDKLPAQDQPIVIYCVSGHRGALVTSALNHLGYTDVRNLGGGINAWKKAELPLEAPGLPTAPAAGTGPVVDPLVFEGLNAFLHGLPDGYLTIKAPDLNAALAEAEKPFVLDVREAGELQTDGMIEGAVNIPVRELWTRLAEIPQDKAAKIVVMCKSGHRGAMVMMALRMNGYTEVTNLAGGMGAWLAAQFPVVQVTQ